MLLGFVRLRSLQLLVAAIVCVAVPAAAADFCCQCFAQGIPGCLELNDRTADFANTVCTSFCGGIFAPRGVFPNSICNPSGEGNCVPRAGGPPGPNVLPVPTLDGSRIVLLVLLLGGVGVLPLWRAARAPRKR